MEGSCFRQSISFGDFDQMPHLQDHPPCLRRVRQLHRVADAPQAPAYYARAMANHALHRKREALSDIDEAVKLSPGNANLREWQAKIRAMP